VSGELAAALTIDACAAGAGAPCTSLGEVVAGASFGDVAAGVLAGDVRTGDALSTGDDEITGDDLNGDAAARGEGGTTLGEGGAGDVVGDDGLKPFTDNRPLSAIRANTAFTRNNHSAATLSNIS
jgi:hypothetical protein